MPGSVFFLNPRFDIPPPVSVATCCDTDLSCPRPVMFSSLNPRFDISPPLHDIHPPFATPPFATRVTTSPSPCDPGGPGERMDPAGLRGHHRAHHDPQEPQLLRPRVLLVERRGGAPRRGAEAQRARAAGGGGRGRGGESARAHTRLRKYIPPIVLLEVCVLC